MARKQNPEPSPEPEPPQQEQEKPPAPEPEPSPLEDPRPERLNEVERARGPLDRRETWDARLKAELIEFADLVRLANWRASGDEEQKALGVAYYDRALDVFKTASRGSGPVTGGYRMDISIFGTAGCGVYLPPDGRLWYTVVERAIGFDWSAAHQLLDRVETLSRHARELWRLDAATLTTIDAMPSVDRAADSAPAARGVVDVGRNPAQRRRAPRRWLSDRRSARKAAQARRILEERRPHCEQAYILCSSVLSAVNLEKLDRLERQGSSRGRAGEPRSKSPSRAFLRRVDVIRPQLELAEREFGRAAQRYARGVYAKGMLLGTGVLALVCVVVAIIFLSYHVQAWYGVALLTGGLGAVVSVLQRMAKGTLRLDYDAGRGTLLTLGAVRPLIGAVFGMVLFAALYGGWLPSINISSAKPLAFYAVLGFLAGFNERFAQDMLVASAATAGSLPAQTDHTAAELRQAETDTPVGD